MEYFSKKTLSNLLFLVFLQGLIFSPFLHGSLNHIANNSIPLFILTTALIYFYRDISLKVLFYGILLSGLITWVIGRESYHVGASSLIYVLVSFIFRSKCCTWSYWYYDKLNSSEYKIIWKFN